MFLSCSFGDARYRQEENKKMIKVHTLCERMEEPFLTPAITINQEQIEIFKLKSYIGQKHYIITKKFLCLKSEVTDNII